MVASGFSSPAGKTEVTLPHRSWLLEKDKSRVVQIDLNPFQEITQQGLRELTHSGSFQRTLAASFNREYAESETASQLLLAGLSIAMELRRRSGIFMIAAGGAFNDFAASDLFCRNVFMKKNHSQLSFFILSEDLPKLINTFNELDIKCTAIQDQIGNTRFFVRSKLITPDPSEIQLTFASDKLPYSLRFEVIREVARGYDLKSGTPDHFIFPLPYLCYPKFYFNIHLSGGDFMLPLIDLKISNFILFNRSIPPDNYEQINIGILTRGLPD